MLSVSELQLILSQTTALPLATEQVAIEYALNRRLAEPIIANINVPPADNSAMDGYAFNFADLVKAGGRLPISARITAGTQPASLTPLSCARIFTGAQIPQGADTVEMQENVDIVGDNDAIFNLKSTKQYCNVRPVGQDIRQGQIIANAGDKLTPALIGLVASLGHDKVSAQKPLRVFLLSTGDEIVEPGNTLTAGKIYNSNRFAIGALLQAWGAVETNYQHVADNLEQTCKALDFAAKHSDLIISFGGVSVGEEDHIKSAVSQLGSINQWKVRLKPGKPIMAGQILNTPILGLPGNPASAYISFLLFAKPLLNALCGTQNKNNQNAHLPLGFDVPKPKQRPEYLRVIIKNGAMQPIGNQSSGALQSLANCDGLAIIDENKLYKTGDTAKFLPIEGLIHD